MFRISLDALWTPPRGSAEQTTCVGYCASSMILEIGTRIVHQLARVRIVRSTRVDAWGLLYKQPARLGESL